MTELKGRHVFAMFATGFVIIIAVNLTLAVNAVKTFPGLEVKNSYVASQKFDQAREAQVALGWDVSAWLDGNQLYLSFQAGEAPVQPLIDSAIFGRATSVGADQIPVFSFDGQWFVAPVQGGGGNWNLRIKATAPDGTTFAQRIIVGTAK